MDVLPLILVMHIGYISHMYKLTFGQTIKLASIIILYFYGRIIYFSIDTFIKNNTWAFGFLLMITFFIEIIFK